MTEIVPVPRHNIRAMWPHAAPHLLRGLSAATDVTLEQVADGLVSGDDQLWTIIDGDEVKATFLSAVFEDADTGQTFLGVYGLGGVAVEAWAKSLGERMAEAAKDAGCASVRFCGRKGWARLLPGYTVVGDRNDQKIFERAVA